MCGCTTSHSSPIPYNAQRASPVRFAGPRRIVPPGVPLTALPSIDFVLLSHDHYEERPFIMKVGETRGF